MSRFMWLHLRETYCGYVLTRWKDPLLHDHPVITDHSFKRLVKHITFRANTHEKFAHLNFLSQLRLITYRFYMLWFGARPNPDLERFLSSHVNKMYLCVWSLLTTVEVGKVYCCVISASTNIRPGPIFKHSPRFISIQIAGDSTFRKWFYVLPRELLKCLWIYFLCDRVSQLMWFE